MPPHDFADQAVRSQLEHPGWLRERGIEPVIAHQKNEKARQGRFDQMTYRRRKIINGVSTASNGSAGWPHGTKSWQPTTWGW